MSDTHELHHLAQVPDGDLFIHAGDFTGNGAPWHIRAFDDWLGTLPHRYKVVIAGNHDLLFEKDPELARGLITNAMYLQDTGVVIEGVKLWGAPWQPWFMDWAFNLERGRKLRQKWALIPKDTQILITHGPPRGIMDDVTGGGSVGCDDLLDAVRRIQPRLHIFGHIHEGFGEEVHGPTRFINASFCQADYRTTNHPIVVDI